MAGVEAEMAALHAEIMQDLADVAAMEAGPAMEEVAAMDGVDAMIAEMRQLLEETEMQEQDTPPRRPDTRRARMDAARAPREAFASRLRAAASYLGDDPFGATDVAAVHACRRRFGAWLQRGRPDVPTQHEHCVLQVNWDVRGGNKKAATFIPLDGILLADLDSRLDTIRMYYTWSLEPKQVPRSGGGLTKLQRFRYLAFAQPSCLDVPDNMEEGQYFWHIGMDWLDSADELHGWTRSLTDILSYRLRDAQYNDACGLISESRSAQQPPGRYINHADLIRRWNRSGGICPCGRHIYIGWEQEWELDDRDAPTGSCLACIQRIDPSVIHLESNVADTMICHQCDTATHYNPVLKHASVYPLGVADPV